MVYSTARRVLGNETQAADVVQETFFQFSRNAHRIQGAVSGWLHRVATRRSYDLIRQESSRRRRERDYSLCHQDPDTSWADLEPTLDAALDDLAEEPRALLIQHYLQGRTTTQIAIDNGWSQPTASRRINAALEALRESFRGRGVPVSMVLLLPLLTQSTQAAPASVVASLGKVLLAHSAAAAASAPSGILGHSKAIAISLSLCAGVGSILYYNAGSRAPDRVERPTTSETVTQIAGSASSRVHIGTPGMEHIQTIAAGPLQTTTTAKAFPAGPNQPGFSAAFVESVAQPVADGRIAVRTSLETSSSIPPSAVARMVFPPASIGSFHAGGRTVLNTGFRSPLGPERASRSPTGTGAATSTPREVGQPGP